MNAEPVTDITVEDGKGGFLGTIPYMSPEHLRGAKKVDTRTDIWALGVIAYELVTCMKPFNGLTKFDLVSKITSTDEHPEPPSKYCRGLPPAIERVIGRCLAKNRDDRFQTVQEFETALREAAGIPAAPPMRPKMASISMESPIDLAQVDEEKTRELTQGKTQAGLTVTNPVPSFRAKRFKVAFAGAGALTTSAAIVGLVLALRGGDGTTSVAKAHAGLGAVISAHKTPMVMPTATTSTNELDADEKAATPSIGATTAKTRQPAETYKVPAPVKTITPPWEQAPVATATNAVPEPKATATSKAATIKAPAAMYVPPIVPD
jgi:hypothetical protein